MEGRRAARAHTERIYVKVTSEFDTTGSMVPLSITWADGRTFALSITWADGRTFAIDAVRDYRPAGTVGNDTSGDCFTVLIQGREKHLFFEHIDPRFTGRLGRWFVEKTVTA